MFIAVQYMIYTFWLLVRFVSTQKECEFSVKKDITAPEPLFLKQNYASARYLNAIILPDSYGFVRTKRNAIISLHCPGSYLIINKETTDIPFATAKCVNDKTFSIVEKNIFANISDITCKQYPARTAKDSGSKCLGKYKLIDLGIELDSGEFLTHIEVCYDDDIHAPVYTSFKLTKSIGGGQVGVNRPDFLSSDVDNDYKLNKLYTKVTQRKTINNLVGLNENSRKYIHDKGSYFLARGHLAAKADFVYSYQQRVTFYYVNVAPQWQTFNGGNWNQLEMWVRRYAASRNVNLQVYTGTYGIITLPNENKRSEKKLVDVYLYTDKNDNRAIPVPELFWKVIHNKRERSGVAIIGVNNPYQTDIELICTDICDEITWIRWKKPKNIAHGYCYCCSVEDFRKRISTFPSFKVKSLLT